MKRPIASLVTSFALHGVGLVLGAWLVSRSLLMPAASPKGLGVEVEVEQADGVELPAMSHTGILGSPNPAALPEPRLILPGGGEHVARPEFHRAGRGGSPESTQAALNLADTNDGLTLNRDPLNRFDRSQVQRLETGHERRSLDDRRATPSPTELSFLATGPGRVLERRPASRVNPSNGSLRGATEPSALGGELGSRVADRGTGPEARTGGSSPGSDRERDPAGVASRALGRDYRFSAAVAVARPQVPKARAAVPAPELGRPNDTVDSSQDVASAVASLIHASSAGARQRGSGPGGDSGGGMPAAGGVQGSGSRALPSGTGPGPARDSGSDARLGAYTAGLRSRLAGWEKAFPTWAIVEGRGGVATVAFTIHPDGRISDLRVARSSGIEEFDRKLVEHVRRAVPFAPPPAILGQRSLPLLFTFDALNPAVGRDGPGRGRVVQR